MKITTKPAPKLDIVQFHIETGRIFNGAPQVIIATLDSTNFFTPNPLTKLTFEVVDDSRSLYEYVEIDADWDLIVSCQNDTKTENGVKIMSKRILDRFLARHYAY